MTTRIRSWQRPSVLVTATAAAALGVGLCAAPASAHTPNWSVTCSSVTVDLSLYNAKVTNTVAVSVDGKALLPTTTFKDSFHKTLELPKHTSPVSVHLVVKAGDGQQYSRDETRTAPACAQSPSPTASAPQAPPSTSPAKPSPSSSSSSAAAAPTPGSSSGGGLADTGSSSATPIIAGAAAAALLAGGGILVASRKRRTARH